MNITFKQLNRLPIYRFEVIVVFPSLIKSEVFWKQNFKANIFCAFFWFIWQGFKNSKIRFKLQLTWSVAKKLVFFLLEDWLDFFQRLLKFIIDWYWRQLTVTSSFNCLVFKVGLCQRLDQWRDKSALLPVHQGPSNKNYLGFIPMSD